MIIHIPGGWWTFCIVFAAMLLFSFILLLIEQFFITRDVLYKRFSMMDLQLAAKEIEIDNLLRGINKMDGPRSAKVFTMLKAHLFVDFLFMPAAYGALFIACMQIAASMPFSGQLFFSVLAWLQVVAWMCDIVENIYLLHKVNIHQQSGPAFSTNTSRKGFFLVFQYVVGTKWIAFLLGTVCIISSLLYFWVSGLYGIHLLKLLIVFVAEVAVFIILCRFFKPAVQSSL